MNPAPSSLGPKGRESLLATTTAERKAQGNSMRRITYVACACQCGGKGQQNRKDRDKPHGLTVPIKETKAQGWRQLGDRWICGSCWQSCRPRLREGLGEVPHPNHFPQVWIGRRPWCPPRPGFSAGPTTWHEIYKGPAAPLVRPGAASRGGFGYPSAGWCTPATRPLG